MSKTNYHAVQVIKDSWAWKISSYWLGGFKCSGCAIAIVMVAVVSYIAIPLIFMANSWIIPKMIFSNFLRWPPFVDPTYPRDFGLNTTRNFYLNVEPGVTIGLWHMLPSNQDLDTNGLDDSFYEESLTSASHVFLYLHGNSGTRASYHRIQLYKILSQFHAHVVALDYRGYADSSGTPTEEGVVNDAQFVYDWLKMKTHGAHIFVWGHSLGTGICVSLAKRLCDKGDAPAGLILEAAYTNIVSAALQHPLAVPFLHFPGFKTFVEESTVEHNIFLRSDQSIATVTSNILFLHAEDDFIIPVALGLELYETAKRSRHQQYAGDLQMVTFSAHHAYGHKNIFKAPDLTDIVRKFIVNCVDVLDKYSTM